MKKTGNNYRNIIESVMCLFTSEDGVVKVLLTRKKNDPYKGYWCLPNDTVSTEETIEENITHLMDEQFQYRNFYMEQSGTFSNLERDPENRIIGVSYLGLIDSVRAFIMHPEMEEIDEIAWFPISNLPKMGYDHEEIVKKAILNLKKELSNTEVLKQLFPGDFTLPEIQKVYEQVLGLELDRRNFRKKFLSFNIIEETGEKTEGHNGRPAMLYRFKEETANKNLF